MKIYIAGPMTGIPDYNFPPSRLRRTSCGDWNLSGYVKGRHMPDADFNEQELADTYWEQERANDRDEYDQHVRHVEEDERDRLAERGE